MIVAENSEKGKGMAKQLRRSVDREALRAARSLACSPKHDKPRKKIVDVEGERVTYRVPRSADKTGHEVNRTSQQQCVR